MQQRKKDFLEVATGLVSKGVEKAAEIIATTFAFGEDGPLTGGGSQKVYVYSNDPAKQKDIRKHEQEERERRERNAKYAPVVIASAAALALFAVTHAHAEEAAPTPERAAITMTAPVPSSLIR